MFLGGAAFATYGSLVPFNFELERLSSVEEWIRNPPQGMSFLTGRIDFFSNVCLSVPIGFGGLAWLTRNERSLWAVPAFLAVMMLGVGLSVLNEAAQVMLPTRVASYSDIVAQFIGTLLGCVAWVAFGPLIRGWLTRLERAHAGQQRLELLLQGYFVVQFCMSVFPLDVTIHPADLYRKLAGGQINLIPFFGHEWNADLIEEMLFFSFTSIPYGALATRLWMPSQSRLRNVADSIALGIAMVVGIEFCQLFVASRFTDTTQIIMGTAGVVIGVLLMHVLWPDHTSRDAARRSWLQTPGTWYAAAMMYAFIPAAFLLWPYEFVFDSAVVQQKLHDMFGLPFDDLLRRSPLPISTIIMRDLLLYWPLGMLIGAGIGLTKSSWRPLLLLSGSLVIVSIAGAVELLQTIVPERHPDLTDVLLSSVAGIGGMCALVWGRRARV